MEKLRVDVNFETEVFSEGDLRMLTKWGEFVGAKGIGKNWELDEKLVEYFLLSKEEFASVPGKQSEAIKGRDAAVAMWMAKVGRVMVPKTTVTQAIQCTRQGRALQQRRFQCCP